MYYTSTGNMWGSMPKSTPVGKVTRQNTVTAEEFQVTVARLEKKDKEVTDNCDAKVYELHRHVNDLYDRHDSLRMDVNYLLTKDLPQRVEALEKARSTTSRRLKVTVRAGGQTVEVIRND